MDTASFLRGYPVDTGLTLGDKQNGSSGKYERISIADIA